MPELLHVGPLPPAPEIFFRDVSSILERRGSPLSIDFLSVFPFEGRSDGLAYDEKLFDKLFSRRERIRPVFRLDHPFRLPGREDWDSGLDEAGSEGLPFLAMRLASAVEDMGELAGGKFAGLMVVASAGESLDPARCSRLAEECGYDPESLSAYPPPTFPRRHRPGRSLAPSYGRNRPDPVKYWETGDLSGSTRTGRATVESSPWTPCGEAALW
jgi:hypothetical protein